jgi:hypothetical protein
MPDPIEELENFTSPGLTMNPMPASEVRRRGTRMRRRHTALATVGGIAAVAVIAAPFAVFAGQGDKADVDPAPPSVDWQQTIPADFPLAEGLPGDPEVTDRPALSDIAACGTTWWTPTAPVAAVDVAGALYAGSEDSSPRTLALYADDAAAREALAAIQSSVDDCPVDPNGAGFDQQQDVIPSNLGEQSLAFSKRSIDESGSLVGEMDVFEAVQVGNALLVTSKHGEGGSSDAMAATASQDLADATAGVVADLCVFSAQGCGDGASATDSGSGSPRAATVIPDGFDLLAGLPSESATQDFGRIGPDRELDPIELDACGKPGPAPDSLDLMRGGFTAPEGERQRQLMTFADEDAAQAYVDDVAALYPCTRDSSQGVLGRYDVADSELGDSGVTAFLHFTVDGDPGPGYEIVHAVRVGQAVLLSRIRVDGENTLITDAVQADLLAQTTSDLSTTVDAMCVFSSSGCHGSISVGVE